MMKILISRKNWKKFSIFPRNQYFFIVSNIFYICRKNFETKFLDNLPQLVLPLKIIIFRSRFFLRNSENKEIEMRIHPNPSHSDYVSYIKRDVLFPQISPADSITVFVEIDVAVETITTNIDDPAAVRASDFGFKNGIK